MTHELTAMIIARAVKVGPGSPEGRRLYMLRAQLENDVSPAQTIAEIEQIQRDGGRYVHEHHGAGR